MRRGLLNTDTVSARGLEKQNGGGSRNKRLVSPAAQCFVNMASPVEKSTDDAIQLIFMAVNQSIACDLSARSSLARRDCFFVGLLLQETCHFSSEKKNRKGSRYTYFKADVDMNSMNAALTYELGRENNFSQRK